MSAQPITECFNQAPPDSISTYRLSAIGYAWGSPPPENRRHRPLSREDSRGASHSEYSFGYYPTTRRVTLSNQHM